MDQADQADQALHAAPSAPWSLRDYYSAGVINALEMSAAERIGALYQEGDEQVLTALALAQAATRVGHLALRLERVREDLSPEVLTALADRARGPDDPPLSAAQWYSSAERPSPTLETLDWGALPNAEAWRARLAKSPAVWCADGGGTPSRPFVLDGAHLFTLKSWRGEAQVAHALSSLTRLNVGAVPNPARLWSRLFGEVGTRETPGEGWFEPHEGEAWDRARLALYTALRGALTILHGGPGTGKTTLTQRILAALFDQYDSPNSERPLRVALAAPTGKAAQRLTESLHSVAPFFHLPEWIQARLQTLQGETLHSLLGIAPGRAKPQYHAHSPLPYDVVVVDEASMVDTWLMRALTQALSLEGEDEHTQARRRLLIIGDPHQLPSVSAGAPFTELCGDRGGRSSEGWRAELAHFEQSKGAQIPAQSSAEGFVDRVVALNQVKRVDEQSGVHRAASLMQKIDELGERALEQVIESLRDPRYRDTALYSAPPFPPHLFEEVCEHYAEAVSLAQVNPLLALQQLKKLCLLSPHYGGPLGVNQLNELVEEHLRERRLGGWGRAYVGRPVLITQNHPTTQLVNGDIGVVGKGKQVHFEGKERPVPFELLPPHRTVYAMSVHKSQGSEFNKVIMCLPPERSPILTRELVYTGLTRAKKMAVVLGSPEVLKASLLAKVERGGQLSKRMEP